MDGKTERAKHGGREKVREDKRGGELYNKATSGKAHMVSMELRDPIATGMVPDRAVWVYWRCVIAVSFPTSDSSTPESASMCLKLLQYRSQVTRCRQTDRQKCRHKRRQMDRWTERQTHRHTDRKTHSETHRKTDGKTHRKTHTARLHQSFPHQPANQLANRSASQLVSQLGILVC